MTRRNPSAACCAALCLGLLAISAGCSSDPESRKQRFLESGNRYFDQQKYREAAIEYRNAIQIDARFGEARWKLAIASERLGDLRTALREFVRAADLLPNENEVQLAAGGYLLAARQFEDARFRAETVLGRDPRNVQAQVLLGNSLAGLRDVDQAIAEIEEAIRLDPLRAASYSNLGILQLTRGRAEAAEEAFKKGVALAPNWIPGHLALANHYWATGRPAEAETSLRAALAIEPTNNLTIRALALFLLSVNRAAEAEPLVKALAASGAAPFALADLYLAQDRSSDAIPELHQLRTRPGTALGAGYRLAQAYALRGDFADAHRIADELLKESPNDSDTLLLKGQLLAQEGRRDEALVRIRAAAEADPNSARAQFALGRSHAARGDDEAARQAYNEVIRLNPRAARAQVELAKLDLVNGRAESSIRFAHDALRNQPGNNPAEVVLIRGLVTSGDIIGAEKRLTPLIARLPKDPIVHVLQALVHVAKDDLRAARRSYERALELDPTSTEATAGLVTIDVAQQNLSDARARIDAAMAVQPDRIDLLLVGARTYAASKNAARTEELLKRAVQVAPSLPQGYHMLGLLYTGQRRLDDAQRQFEKLAEREARPVAALTMLGMIAQIRKDQGAAQRYYERVMDLDRRAPIAANNLAWIYAERGERLDAALDFARSATEALPQSAETQDTLGWVYLKREMPKEAAAVFRKALELAPRNPTIHYHLGLAYAQLGETSRARESLQAALGLNSTFAEAPDARLRLEALQAGGR